MYNVTQAFLSEIISSPRQVYGKVQIDYTDPFIDQSINITCNEQANVSFTQQTADGITNVFGKIASLDGSWVLGEGYVLCPDVNESELYQMGWWGAQLSNGNCFFSAPYPTLTATFASRPVLSLKVVGDDKRGEYPVDFTIRLYGTGNNLKHTEAVTGNTLVTWDKNITTVTEVVKMELEIVKWSNSNRQAKISEFFTSIQETYEGENIIDINLLEEREVSNGSLPIGNLSANEITVKLSNETRKFDASNTTSPLYQLVKTNRRVKAWLGVLINAEYEYVPLGVFWSGDWDAPEDGVYAKTTGQDRLELLRKSSYSTSQVLINVSLYDLAVSVMQDAGLTNEEYWIDDDLKLYSVPYAYFESQSHRDALRVIAEASLGQVYCDRNGVLRLESALYSVKKANQFIMPFMSASEGISITDDNYFKKNRPVKSDEISNYIEVETQPLKPDILSELYRSNNTIPIEPGHLSEFTVYYNNVPAINANAALEGATNTVITNAIYYAWGAEVTLQNNGAVTENVTLVINGNPMKILNKEKAVAQDAASITEYGKLKYTFPSNPLIQTLAIAQSIASTLLHSYKNSRRDIVMEWRGNPALLLGDSVITKESNLWEQFYVTRQEIEYDGTLRATLNGRKI